jgi:hypothetical protein
MREVGAFLFPAFRLLLLASHLRTLRKWCDVCKCDPLAAGVVRIHRKLITSPNTLSIPTSNFPPLTSHEYALEESVSVWAVPFSLATTGGIVYSFSSSGYLDVSVPQVPSDQTMCSSGSTSPLRLVGFPIRTPPDQCLLSTPRGFSQIAASFIGS